jgi:hypothetical protein
MCSENASALRLARVRSASIGTYFTHFNINRQLEDAKSFFAANNGLVAPNNSGHILEASTFRSLHFVSVI